MTDDNNPNQRPYSKYDVLRRQPEVPNTKSYAQVATLVLPQAVIPNSCGLKPEISNRRQEAKKQKKTVKRASPLSARLSDKERAIIIQKAFNIGYNVNAYVRAAALGSDFKPPMNRELLRALLATNRELTMHGHNLNQIAKHMNAGLVHLDEAEGLIGQIARSMFRAHKAIRVALTDGKTYPDD